MVVHRPEPVLRSGRLRGERGPPRVLMLAHEREVPEDEQDAVLIRGQDPLEAGQRLHAERALVVAVLDQLDRRVGRPELMVLLAHRPRQGQRPIVETNRRGEIVSLKHGLFLHWPRLLTY